MKDKIVEDFIQDIHAIHEQGERRQKLIHAGSALMLGGFATGIAAVAVTGNFNGNFDALANCKDTLGPGEAQEPMSSKVEDVRELIAGGARLCHEGGDVFRIVMKAEEEKSRSLTTLHQR